MSNILKSKKNKILFILTALLIVSAIVFGDANALPGLAGGSLFVTFVSVLYDVWKSRKASRLKNKGRHVGPNPPKPPNG
tara:strand:+ start:605 stop:841 length:237 start_codon:yes stop_codon:yes gene_type:complete